MLQLLEMSNLRCCQTVELTHIIGVVLLISLTYILLVSTVVVLKTPGMEGRLKTSPAVCVRESSAEGKDSGNPVGRNEFEGKVDEWDDR